MQAFERQNFGILGKDCSLPDSYAAHVLEAIPRRIARKDFLASGIDLWNAYEFAWKASLSSSELFFHQSRLLLEIDSSSTHILESKSLKFYLYSLRNIIFSSKQELIDLMEKDFLSALGSRVRVSLFPAHEKQAFEAFEAFALDDLSLSADAIIHPSLSLEDGKACEQSFVTHALRSLCPQTRQPDWATLWIHSEGLPINASSLFAYILSLAEKEAFHEDCVERLFLDLMSLSKDRRLSVYARYTRRGGIDINPFRSNWESCPGNCRQYRQ